MYFIIYFINILKNTSKLFFHRNRNVLRSGFQESRSFPEGRFIQTHGCRIEGAHNYVPPGTYVTGQVSRMHLLSGCILGCALSVYTCCHLPLSPPITYPGETQWSLFTRLFVNTTQGSRRSPLLKAALAPGRCLHFKGKS